MDVRRWSTSWGIIFLEGADWKQHELEWRGFFHVKDDGS
jgi:hypothetical protein